MIQSGNLQPPTTHTPNLPPFKRGLFCLSQGQVWSVFHAKDEKPRRFVCRSMVNVFEDILKKTQKWAVIKTHHWHEPWNTGWLIGILIIGLIITNHYNWVVNFIPYP